MCASYGLGGGRYDQPLPWDLPPLDERVVQERIEAWMAERRGVARITGKNARNLNPLVVADVRGRDVEMAWWWIHRGDQPAPYSAFNAKGETLTQKWRFALARRALAPATWYIEKKRRCGLGGELFALAAITTTARQADGSELLTYALVTRAAVGAAADVHPRMPLILPREMHDEWLDPDVTADPEMVAAMVTASDEISRAVEVN